MKNPKHVQFIRELPCVITLMDAGVQPHHLMRDDMGRIIRGMGKRAGDQFCIPLHHKRHDDLHNCGDEVGYLEKSGILYPVELSLILFDHTGDHEFCERVIRAWNIDKRRNDR